jgi:hypothetical protein
MKIYKSNKLLTFLKRSINDDNKIVYLRYCLDLIRHMLFTSTKLRDFSFLNYVKRNLTSRLTEIISSFDRYTDSKSLTFRIFDEYQIISPDDRNNFYISALIDCVQNCPEDHYQRNLQYLVIHIRRNISNVSKIRKRLTSIRRSTTIDRIKMRCDDLLQYYN